MNEDPLDRLVDKLSAGPAYFFIAVGLAFMAFVIVSWVME